MSATPYTVGGRCLAYHGPLLYEAKILKIYDPATRKARAKAQPSEVAANGGSHEKEVPAKDLPVEMEGENAYFVHYKGWKSTWDEWVEDARVLMWNEENIRTQKQLKQKALEAMNRSKTKTSGGGPGSGDVKRSRDPDPGSGGAGSTRKRRHTTGGSTASTASATTTTTNNSHDHHDLEREEEFIRRPEVSLLVPDALKSQLVDDWEYVTKEHQLVPLPRKPTVVDVLKMYRDSVGTKQRQSSAEADILDEVLSGLKLYFDRCLGNILLYRFERQQYLEVRKSHADKAMSEVYGAEHLLRLFVSLPGLIAQTNMDEQGINHLRDHLEELLRFLVKRQSELFLKEYEHTTPNYESLAKGY